MRFESYSQFCEDLALYVALRKVVDSNVGGFYIDVGANDPTMDSVTKFFYDKGWHGINVEPLPNKCALLAEKRPRDINLCCGLSSKYGRAKIFESDGMSTFSEEIAKSDIVNKVMNVASAPQREKIMLTLQDVYEKYCTSEQEIHFCKIDVEGFEKEVLLGIEDWRKFRPWIFVIESTFPTTEIPTHEEWEYILLKNDYVFVDMVGINRFYVSLEREYLIDELKKLSQFVSQNEIVVMRMQRLAF